MERRNFHASCAIKSEMGIIKYIVVVGGNTRDFEGKGVLSSSTEIFNINKKEWTRGPDFPIKVLSSACVALPSHMKFSCLSIGGFTHSELDMTKNIYGLDHAFKAWTLVGYLKEARSDHVVLSIQ